MIYIGIDPGKDGGISVIHPDGFVGCGVYTDESLIECCEDIKNYDMFCIVENVHSMPMQGAQATFNFGKSFGYILGVLESFGVPYELVNPQKWKKEFSCTSDKNTSIDCAQRLFPNVNLYRTDRCRKKHDGMAESLLMAEYGRRHYNGQHKSRYENS